MRKLARQAVILALLGLLVTATGYFAFLTKDIRTTANKAAALAVHSFAQGKVSALRTDADLGLHRMMLPDDIGFVSTFDDPDWGDAWHQLNESILFNHLIEVPVMDRRILYFTECQSHADEGGNCVFLPQPNQITKDYWTAYEDSEHKTLLQSGTESLKFGLWGFAGGIGIWAFYGIVRFAIKG
jgi:hypothetical protein